MKKNIWIFNHYAGTPTNATTFIRHYYFAKYFIEWGHKATVFAASQVHNSDKNFIQDDALYKVDDSEGVPFVYVRTSSYSNTLKRILNLFQFFFGLFRVTKKFDKPDAIIASSPHPLTLIAAILISKKYRCRCIIEVRDLWPESFVAYNVVKNKLILKMLYLGEKWIYKKADKLVFTMEGGKDYIIEKGWDKEVNLSKINHVNNGVDLEEYSFNRDNFTINDSDLNDTETFKVVYTGSIRRVNDIGMLLDSSKIIENLGYDKVKFLIYGAGDQVELLKERCLKENITNFIFKGSVKKKYIPYILSKSDLNLIHVQQTDIMRFGCSLNKLFEYLASGKPILSDLKVNYDVLEKYNAGFTLQEQTPIAISNKIIDFMKMTTRELDSMGNNASTAALEYDYKNLALKYLSIVVE